MKVYRCLLVAPAVLGLISPIAAIATEQSLTEISNHSPSANNAAARNQNINHFSDIHPGDWAYQALNNLSERHGCKAASPNGSMTRLEFAVLLNKCLKSVSQINEEEQSLIDEFRTELAVINILSQPETLSNIKNLLNNNVSDFEAGISSGRTTL